MSNAAIRGFGICAMGLSVLIGQQDINSCDVRKSVHTLIPQSQPNLNRWPGGRIVNSRTSFERTSRENGNGPRWGSNAAPRPARHHALLEEQAVSSGFGPLIFEESGRKIPR